MKLRVASALLLAIATSAVAKERKIIEPLPAEIVAANHVVEVEVAIAGTAAAGMPEFEAKAAEKRVAAKLPPVDASVPAADAPRPPQDEYSTLPFARMFPLVMQDVTREWGLTGGRAVKLKVTVDTLKTANAAMAMLMSSRDRLAGLVEVQDAVTGAPLGSFYIDVLNGHYGTLGLMTRGGGIREKLVEEFALQTSRVLTGRKSKNA